LQAQGTVGHPQTYAGATDVVRKTYAAEGIRGFYKGLAPALTKVVPSAAITYLVYDKSKTIFHLK
ncbi:9543_t:CDS:2, partial [Paraglomus occultum]